MPATWQEPEEWKKDGSIISGVSSLKTGAWTSMLMAKETRNGKQVEVVIKTFSVPEEIVADPERVAREREKFLASARLQKELSDSGCAGWVDVLRYSENPPSFSMKKCSASLQDLLDRKVYVSAHDLYQIVLSVLQGFNELYVKHRRSHGSLKASDVLSVPNENPPYQLSDPAPKGDDHSANDLYALGLILFQLVEHKEWDPLTPIIPTKNWSRFGSRRDRWIQFFNMLLSPNGCQEPLSAVRREALRLKPASPVAGLTAAAACVLMLAAAGAAVWYYVAKYRPVTVVTTNAVANAGPTIDPVAQTAWQKARDAYTAINEKWTNRERTERYDHAGSTEVIRAARALITDRPLSDTDAFVQSAGAYAQASTKVAEALLLYEKENAAGLAADKAALDEFNAARADFDAAKAAWDQVFAAFKPGHDHARSTAIAQATIAPPSAPPEDVRGRQSGAELFRLAAKRYTDALALAREESIAGTSVEQAQATFQETRSKFQQARDRWDAAAVGVAFDISAARKLYDEARGQIPDQVVLTNTASYQAATELYTTALQRMTRAYDELERIKREHNQQEADVTAALARAGEALDKKDDAAALAWYRRAADLGHAVAMYNVGVFYETGRGTDRNVEEAARWYQKAADQNHPRALATLGLFYERGSGVERDVKKALDLYKKAADLKEVSAMRAIAYFYDTGVGMTRDSAEALRWYQKAADLNDATAMFMIGSFYEQGKAVAIDYRQAITWYTKSADLKNPRAMNALGILHETGRGVAQDLAKALDWYKKAAELNYPPAMSNVGAMYDQGIGVRIDPAEAIKWFRKGADLGHPMSMYNLGVLYETGRGTAPDLRTALEWYRQAGRSDDEQAKRQALERLRALGFPP